jgi:hypothetical protein
VRRGYQHPDHPDANGHDSTAHYVGAGAHADAGTRTDARANTHANGAAGSEFVRDLDRHQHRDDRFQRRSSAKRHDVRVRAFKQ